MDKQQTTGQHDERIFREGVAIFSEGDLRELINYIYSEYQYNGTQSDKLIKVINYLTSENNRYLNPELAGQSKKLSAYLDTFLEFLKFNFRPGKQNDEGDTIYFFQVQETGSETEAFLAEFQMLALDAEKAYRNYRAAIKSKLEL
jgi:hypothetical protein